MVSINSNSNSNQHQNLAAESSKNNIYYKAWVTVVGNPTKDDYPKHIQTTLPPLQPPPLPIIINSHPLLLLLRRTVVIINDLFVDTLHQPQIQTTPPQLVQKIPLPTKPTQTTPTIIITAATKNDGQPCNNSKKGDDGIISWRNLFPLSRIDLMML